MKRISRKFLFSLAAAGVVTAFGSSLVYATRVEPFTVEEVEQEIRVPRLGPGLQGLRIAQISDLHLGGFVHRAQILQVVERIVQQKPDLVFITGDFFTRHGNTTRALQDLDITLGLLSRHAPVMAVLGNHDHKEGLQGLRILFQKHNILELTNSVQHFRRGGDVLYIAGVDSVIAGHQKLRAVERALPENAPAILLAHEPDTADYSSRSGRFALQLSGHSHGGQVTLPGIGRPVLPWMGRKYPAGLYRVRDMWLYTNRGIGTIHLPIRFNSPPEITLFTLQPSTATD